MNQSENQRWDHSIHYHSILLNNVPPNAARALDIGCGSGVLTRSLRTLVPHVVGIDVNQPMIDLARSETDSSIENIEYILGDALTYPLKPASSDAIVCVATLHHMDTAVALQRMRELLRPGGTLGIIGLARSGTSQDLIYNIGGAVATRVYRLNRTLWRHPAPTHWPPKDSYSGVRRIANSVLPGALYRRQLLFRYTLTWTKPQVH